MISFSAIDMTEEKLIVIGCDDTVNLSIVPGCLKKLPAFPQNIISASRVSDMMGLVRSLNPDLVILCFRHMQGVLSDLSDRPDIPLFCLTPKWGSEALSWNRNSIVFTYPLEQIGHPDCFSSMRAL